MLNDGSCSCWRHNRTIEVLWCTTMIVDDDDHHDDWWWPTSIKNGLFEGCKTYPFNGWWHGVVRSWDCNLPMIGYVYSHGDTANQPEVYPKPKSCINNASFLNREAITFNVLNDDIITTNPGFSVNDVPPNRSLPGNMTFFVPDRSHQGNKNDHDCHD